MLNIDFVDNKGKLIFIIQSRQKLSANHTQVKGNVKKNND